VWIRNVLSGLECLKQVCLKITTWIGVFVVHPFLGYCIRMEICLYEVKIWANHGVIRETTDLFMGKEVWKGGMGRCGSGRICLLHLFTNSANHYTQTFRNLETSKVSIFQQCLHIPDVYIIVAFELNFNGIYLGFYLFALFILFFISIICLNDETLLSDCIYVLFIYLYMLCLFLFRFFKRFFFVGVRKWLEFKLWYIWSYWVKWFIYLFICCSYF